MRFWASALSRICFSVGGAWAKETEEATMAVTNAINGIFIGGSPIRCPARGAAGNMPNRAPRAAAAPSWPAWKMQQDARPAVQLPRVSGRAERFDRRDLAQPQVNAPGRRGRIVEPHHRVDALAAVVILEQLDRRAFGHRAGHA